MSLPTAGGGAEAARGTGARRNVSGDARRDADVAGHVHPESGGDQQVLARALPRWRSAWARAAASTAVIAWTTAGSCTQSNSELWI